MKQTNPLISRLLSVSTVILMAVHLVVGLPAVTQLCLMALVVLLAYQSHSVAQQLRLLKLQQAVNAHANRETRIRSAKSGCFPTITVS